jgi:DNA helicase-2/ATP-dependent DNA helicase PcrA
MDNTCNTPATPDRMQPPAPLCDVTPQQREAIEHEDGPMLVLAGAGSGKTRVITHRIARLIEKGIPSRAILSITFTNKAAGEMVERVHRMVPGERPWVSTFHSFCARLLREDIERVGYKRTFTIFDEGDALSVVKEALEEVGAGDSLRPPAVRSAISRWKSQLAGPDQAYATSGGSFHVRKTADAYRVYVRRLKEQNALDFDDLLLKALEVLRLDAEARDKWTRRFMQIQVDEYQDTNRIQFELVKILAGSRRNVTVVGDPDQSIYSWRGAEPRNIDEFVAHFSGARVVRLADNFRSMQTILDAASAVIARAEGQRVGPLRGVRGAGNAATLVVTTDEGAEAREVASRAGRLVRAGRSARDIAVFYRTNAQSRAFEEAFIREGIPYALVGATAFYQRREVKDALTYLRVALNRADDTGFRRIANVPRRGLGAGALAKLEVRARDNAMPLAESIREPAVRGVVPARAAAALQALDALLGRLAEIAPRSAGDAVAAAIVESGLSAMYQEMGERDRTDNLDELKSAAAEYDTQHPGEGVSGFIEQAALISDLDQWDSAPDRVTLMTLHAAKGLEFKTVFIAGLEDGLLPHIRAVNAEESSSMDEERRLLYVGMTRAEDELTLTCARNRRQGGQCQTRVRSRFLEDVPSNLVRVENRALDEPAWTPPERAGARWRSSPDGYPIEADRDADADEESRAVRRAMAGADALESDAVLDIGDRVNHPKFGRGKVVEIKGAGPSARITVDFHTVGCKMLAAGFANLTRA